MTTRTKTTDVENLNDEVVQETVSAPAKKKAPRKFEQNDPILCRSVTYGELLYPAKKSQLLYSWANYGDTTEVEYQDLQALRSTRSAYLNAPYFIIEDEELLEQWPEFKKLYEKIATADIDKIFDMPINKFKAALRNLPSGFKDSIKNIASAKILDGTLDSISKIKAIDEVFNTDLKLLIE